MIRQFVCHHWTSNRKHFLTICPMKNDLFWEVVSGNPYFPGPCTGEASTIACGLQPSVTDRTLGIGNTSGHIALLGL